MIMSQLAVATISLSLTFAAAAQVSSPPPVQPVEPGRPAEPDEVVVRGKIPDADKKVCKTEASTGSIIPKRVCRPKWQWELMRQRAIAALEQVDRERRARQHVNDMRDNQ